MSWSVGHTGALQDVRRELRDQIARVDTHCGVSPPAGMSAEENLIRRQACTLLLMAVEAQAPIITGPEKRIKATAWGSESRYSPDAFLNEVHVEVSVITVKSAGDS